MEACLIQMQRLLLGVAILLLLCFGSVVVCADGETTTRKTLFEAYEKTKLSIHGWSEYEEFVYSYHVPSLAEVEGTMVAVAEARCGGYTSGYAGDIMTKYSTDQGNTWKTIVAIPRTITKSYARSVLPTIVPQKGNLRLFAEKFEEWTDDWTDYKSGNGDFVHSLSSNVSHGNGGSFKQSLTFSNPMSLLPEISNEMQSLQITRLIGGYGRGIEVNGTSVVPVWFINNKGEMRPTVLLSGSTNWSLSKGTGDPGSLESAVVEWEGKLIMNARTNDGYRKVYESTDMGNTWNEALGSLSRVWGNAPNRQGYGTSASFITVNIENISVMLFSHPLNTKGEGKRDKLHLWLTDNKRIYNVGQISAEGENTGHSSLLYTNGNLYCLYEKDKYETQKYYSSVLAHLVYELKKIKEVVKQWKTQDNAFSEPCDGKDTNPSYPGSTCEVHIPQKGLVGFFSDEATTHKWKDTYSCVDAEIKGGKKVKNGIKFNAKGAGAMWPVGRQGQNQRYHFMNHEFTLATTMILHECSATDSTPLLSVVLNTKTRTTLIGSGCKGNTNISNNAHDMKFGSSTIVHNKALRVAITFQKGVAKLYREGKLILQKSPKIDSGLLSTPISHICFLQCTNKKVKGYAHATLQNVLLYNRVLSKKEIDLLYLPIIPTRTPTISKTNSHTNSLSKTLSTTETSSRSLSHTTTKSLSHKGTHSQSLSHTGSESLSLSHTGSESLSLSHTGSESQSLSHTRSESQSLSHTGSESQSLSHTRSESQSLSHTGSESQSLSHTRSESQSLSHTGSESQSLSHTGSESQSLSHTGSESQSLSHTRSESQSLSHTGSESQSLSHTRSESQSLSHTGSESQSLSHTGSESQSLSHTRSESPSLSHTHDVIEQGSGKGMKQDSSFKRDHYNYSQSQPKSSESTQNPIKTSDGVCPSIIVETVPSSDLTQKDIDGSNKGKRILLVSLPKKLYWPNNDSVGSSISFSRGSGAHQPNGFSGKWGEMLRSATWRRNTTNPRSVLKGEIPIYSNYNIQSDEEILITVDAKALGVDCQGTLNGSFIIRAEKTSKIAKTSTVVNSVIAGMTAVTVFGAGGVGSVLEIQALSLLSRMNCAPKEERYGLNSLPYFTSIFVHFGSLWIVLGNAMIVVIFGSIHYGITVLYKNMRGGDLSKAWARMFFPSFTHFVAYIMHIGIFVHSVSLLFIIKAEWHHYIVGIAGTSYGLIFPFFVIYYVAHYVEVQFVPYPHFMNQSCLKRCLAPIGYWTPRNQVKMYGSIFFTMKGGYLYWCVFCLAVFCIAGIVTVIPTSTENCHLQYFCLMGIFLFGSIVTAVTNMMRSRFLTLMHTLSLLLLTTLCFVGGLNYMLPNTMLLNAYFLLTVILLIAVLITLIYDACLLFYDWMFVKNDAMGSTTINEPFTQGKFKKDVTEGNTLPYGKEDPWVSMQRENENQIRNEPYGNKK